MNEQIEQLANECGLAWTLKTEQDIKNLAEFAELVERQGEAKHFSAGYTAGVSTGTIDAVRVCMSVCEKYAGGGSNAGWTDASATILEEIRQMFGIE